jgi:hypothetical protein
MSVQSFSRHISLSLNRNLAVENVQDCGFTSVVGIYILAVLWFLATQISEVWAHYPEDLL